MKIGHITMETEKNSSGYSENEWITSVIHILNRLNGPNGYKLLDVLPIGMSHKTWKTGDTSPDDFAVVLRFFQML